MLMVAAVQMAATSVDWLGVAGVTVAGGGLIAVMVQLRKASAVSRATATIQFQRAFKDSRGARKRLLETFPIHEDLLEVLATPETRSDFRTWKSLKDLTPQERDEAEAVTNAMNDVAQYVADGLSLRSALQQYHTIFVRTGVLLFPYLNAYNAPHNGRSQSRYGRRVVMLYNAGLAYHRAHPKHKRRELVLKRRSVRDSQWVRLVLVDTNGTGAQEQRGFEDEDGGTTPRMGPRSRIAVWRAERKLRRR